MSKFQVPRGTVDVLPPDARRRLRLVEMAGDVLGRAGYEPMETPVFEDTELFARGVGESTDIVQKEMFTFEDKAGRSLTLRPEATAGICRAYVEHGMHKLPQPVKVWTAGPFFRHEAPQAGRFRQFTQIDAEALGSDDPTLDSELILLLAEIYEGAGTGPSRLRLSSLGTPETRADYIDELRGYLRTREGELSEEVRGRLEQNPLRAFDADHPGTQAVMADAPRLVDRLTAEDAEHFAEVRTLLEAAGLPYEDWSRSSAGRRLPEWAGPRAWSGCCSPLARRTGPGTPTSSSPSPTAGTTRSCSPSASARLGCGPRWNRPAGA